MKAVVFHGIGDIRLDKVHDPKLKDPTDAIVRLTANAICGTDLHMIRGTFPGMEPGTILGHESARTSATSTSATASSSPPPSPAARARNCRAGYSSQCDEANPNGKDAGTAFFGGPKPSGPFQGLQAEYARVPFAHADLVELPPEVSDDQAILISDIFPSAYFGANIANIQPGETVAVFGCGPVGQFAIASAHLLGAGRILAIDTVASRLAMARAQGAEVIDFNEEDPVEATRRLTNKIGVDRAIDAVGVDAVAPHQGPAAKVAKLEAKQHEQEVQEVAPKTNPDGVNWIPGDAPSQVLSWAVQGLAKAGTLSIIGVYPETARFFPIGIAMNKNLTLRMGNCPHRKYLPKLVGMVRSGLIDPLKILTQREPLTDVIAAYKAFDTRQPGWIKVELQPAS